MRGLGAGSTPSVTNFFMVSLHEFWGVFRTCFDEWPIEHAILTNLLEFQGQGSKGGVCRSYHRYRPAIFPYVTPMLGRHNQGVSEHGSFNESKALAYLYYPPNTRTGAAKLRSVHRSSCASQLSGCFFSSTPPLQKWGVYHVLTIDR